jgi:hypothetical protein
MHAVNNSFGEQLLTPSDMLAARRVRSARRVGGVHGDYDMQDVHHALCAKKSPYDFKHVGSTKWKVFFECETKCTSGIYIVRCGVRNLDQSIDEHFFAIDFWRGVILDDCQESPLYWPAAFNAKQVRTRICRFERVFDMYKLWVHSDRLRETPYV